MKVSYNWLRDYCHFDLPAHRLAGRLSHAGLGVETYEPRGDDWMLDVEVKSNRPDCLSHLGVAREVAAVTGGTLRRPAAEIEQADRGIADACSVEVTAPDLCPRYTARVIVGLSVAPSPQWLQDRLAVCGIRPVNNVVDATNYVMFESGQPLHAFDMARLGDGRIIVRRAGAGETITTIDGTTHELSGEECVIADASKPVALAGVMGGIESEISETTTDVLIESARFEPTSVRRTSRALGLSSESSYRFERGVDPEITDWASRRACRLILELAGGELLNGSFDLRVEPAASPEVTMRYARLKLVLGIDVPPDEVARIFDGLELALVRSDDRAVTVRVPSWRGDLTREIDLIEEVARIHGYDRIGETTDMPVRAAVPSLAEVAEARARSLLAGHGFCEVLSYSLIAPTPLQLAQPWHEGEPMALRNPVTVDRTHLRLTNMGNLAEAKRHNSAHGVERVDLFELGHVFIPRGADEQPDEKLLLTLLTDRDDGLRVLKGVLANLLDELGVEDTIDETPGNAGPFEPDEALLLGLDGQRLGCAGVMSAGFAEELDLRRRPALLEVDLARLVELCRLDRPYRPIPTFPATQRDLAVVVGEQVLWADIESCVRRSAPEMLESLEMFDVYRGDQVPAGSKSVAFAMTFRRTDRTITAEEAEHACQAILAALREELGARLR